MRRVSHGDEWHTPGLESMALYGVYLHGEMMVATLVNKAEHRVWRTTKNHCAVRFKLRELCDSTILH